MHHTCPPLCPSHQTSVCDSELPFLSLLALSPDDLCCPSVGNLVHLVTKVTGVRKTTGSVDRCLRDKVIHSWKQVMQDHESTQNTLLDTVHAKKWKHIRSSLITNKSGNVNIITHRIQQPQENNNEPKSSPESSSSAESVQMTTDQLSLDCTIISSTATADDNKQLPESSSKSSSISEDVYVAQSLTTFNNTCTNLSLHEMHTNNKRTTAPSSPSSTTSTSPLKVIDSGRRLSKLSKHLEVSGTLTPNKQNQTRTKPIVQADNSTSPSINCTNRITATTSNTTRGGTTSTTTSSSMDNDRLSTNHNGDAVDDDDDDGTDDSMEPFLESRGPGRKRLTTSAHNHLKRIIKSLVRKYDKLEQTQPGYSKATMWAEMGIVFTSDTEKDYAFKMLRGICLPAIFRLYLKHKVVIDAFVQDSTQDNEDDDDDDKYDQNHEIDVAISNKQNEEHNNDEEDEEDVDGEEDQKEPWKVKSHSRGGYVLSEKAKQQLQVISDSLINIYNQKCETEPSLSRTAMYENMGIVFNDKHEKDYALKILYPKLYPTGYRFYLKNKSIIDQFIDANQTISQSGTKKRSRVSGENNIRNKKQRRDSDNNGTIDYGNIEDSVLVESCTRKIKQLKQRDRDIGSLLITTQATIDEKMKQIQQLKIEIKAIKDSTSGLDDEKMQNQIKIDSLENVLSAYKYTP